LKLSQLILLSYLHYYTNGVCMPPVQAVAIYTHTTFFDMWSSPYLHNGESYMACTVQK